MKVSNDVDLKQIVEDTELFTGAELEGLCREAGIVALREDISASVVCNRHFQTKLKKLPRTDAPDLSRAGEKPIPSADLLNLSVTGLKFLIQAKDHSLKY
ncbi:hypothetical protein CsSME_00028233 [Camellia sinensis var. sinensis]